MANPVSNIPAAQVPYMETEIVTDQNTSTVLFHRFITGLWQRTGGSQGINNADVQEVANQALAQTQGASQTANAAQTTATAALTAATSAEATADAAAKTAQLALTQSGSNAFLSKTANLSDVSSAISSRQNIGINLFPITFNFDTCPNALRRGIPIVRAMTMPANFKGTVCYQAINTTNDAVFNVQVYRNAAYFPIGTINFVHGGTGYNLSTQAAFQLLPGDTLIVQCPSPVDPSLAQAAITFPLQLV